MSALDTFGRGETERQLLEYWLFIAGADSRKITFGLQGPMRMYDAEHYRFIGGRLMRTTLAIDDDILAAAKHLADREHTSVGKVLSDLARQGLDKQFVTSRPVRNGIPLLATRKDATRVTLELVNRLRDAASPIHP